MANIEYKTNGIKCDNAECGWKDETVPDENMREWINRPCPSCGENLLTQKDYDDFEKVKEAIAFMNSFTPEQIEQMNSLLGVSPEEANKLLTGTIDVHNGIQIHIDENPQ